ncbi:MAG TPA: hypothetical protein VHU24_04225 [Solirubrobacterales bacterium]|jgi:hypothetical protein|nr:hypothetical protein [Solirubrobacterales bacterium]
MATDNPTCGERVVSLDLPAEHIPILRDRLTDWLEGVREDLKTPERMENPGEARQEAQTYERLLVGLTIGQMFLPDDAARAAVEAAAAGYDEGSNYAEIAANHSALHALLAVLAGGRT